METIKCRGCNKKIAEVDGTDLKLSIKCPRCRAINQITIQKAIEPLISTPRASDKEGDDNEQSTKTNRPLDWR